MFCIVKKRKCVALISACDCFIHQCDDMTRNEISDRLHVSIQSSQVFMTSCSEPQRSFTPSAEYTALTLSHHSPPPSEKKSPVVLVPRRPYVSLSSQYSPYPKTIRHPKAVYRNVTSTVSIIMTTTSTINPPETVTVGIDVGSQSTKIVLGSTVGCEIVRNDVGGHATPSCVEFSGKIRKIGQAPGGSKSKNIVVDLHRWLAGELDADADPFVDFLMMERNSEDGTIVVQYQDAPASYSPTAVLAMFLGKIRLFVHSTLERIASSRTFQCHYVLSIGPETCDQAKLEWLDAAYAAGLESVQLVESPLCSLYCYQRKFPEFAASTNKVLVVDMGKTQTTVSLLGRKSEDEKPQVLGCTRNKSLGAGSFDIRLWEHFHSTLPALGSVSKRSREGQRLLDGCARLKHLLSQLGEGNATVENIQDRDVQIHATRSHLVELCHVEAKTLQSMILSTLEKAGVSKEELTSVEVSGGGCRIPFVKDIVLETVGSDTLSLSYSLDETSTAMGAALIGEDTEVKHDDLPDGGDRSAIREKLKENEDAMAALDQDMHARSDFMNKIESHVLSMRSAKQSKHGSLIPASELDAYLDDVDNWLFSEQADDATKDDMVRKYEEVIAKTGEIAKEYLAKVQEEKEAIEKEMEAEAQKAKEDRKGDDEDEEDHDNRRLPKKRRMEIVLKNKAEANELFSDGNYKFAAARYTKALSHCAKFVDLNPEDTEEVNGVKLSLNLNLALAYTKLENFDQALRVCNDALAIDAENTKALYRRASVYYEKKIWDKAKADIKKAEDGAPDDKAVKKLREKIDAQLKRQKEKEKKMAAKMFG